MISVISIQVFHRQKQTFAQTIYNRKAVIFKRSSQHKPQESFSFVNSQADALLSACFVLFVAQMNQNLLIAGEEYNSTK